MNRMNGQTESMYACRILGGAAADFRYMLWFDGANSLSRQFPGANGITGGNIDPLPLSTSFSGTQGVTGVASEGITGLGFAGIFPSMVNGSLSGTCAASVSISGITGISINHLTTPISVTATDLGTGTPSNYLLNVSWSNASSYGSADLMYVYNNSGNAILGIGLANAGSTIIDGLNNTSYTVYCKATYNGSTFSSASNTSTATPTSNYNNIPPVYDVLVGVPVGITGIGTLQLPSSANVLLGVPVGSTGIGTLNIASQVMTQIVEPNTLIQGVTGMNVKQALQLLSAVELGTTSISGSTVTFKDPQGIDTRVVATMSGSQRVSITPTTTP